MKMKRYRLKKDLPTFETGEEFYIDGVGNLKRSEDALTAYCRSTLDKFPSILTDWFEEIREKPKTVWDLKDGDTYYFIDDYNFVIYIGWESSFGADIERRDAGNVFLSREEAEKELARRKAKQVLLRDTKGFKPDWRDESQQKFVVYFDHCYGNLCIDFWCTYHSSSIHFASEADAVASIRAHEKEWKIYLGVEE